MTSHEPPSLGSYRPDDRRNPQSQLRIAEPGGRRPVRPAASRGLGRILLFVLGGASLLVVLGAVWLVLFAPVDLVRNQLIAQVKANTGRDLVVRGPTTLSFFPKLAVSMADVSLSAPPKMGGRPMVQMERLQVRLPLLPLLRREVKVDQLVMTKPVVLLRVDKSGRRSWDFANRSRAGRVRFAQAATKQSDVPTRLPPSGNSGLGPVEDIVIGDVRIMDGVIRYADERSQISQAVSGVYLTLNGGRLAAPLDASGRLTWRGEQLTFKGRLNTTRDLIGERPARVNLALSGPSLSATYDGRILVAKHVTLTGPVTLKSAHLRRLAGWFGISLKNIRGLRTMSIAGQLRVTSNDIQVKEAKVKLDQATASGDIGISLARARPRLTAGLRVDVLDLNDYMANTGNLTSDRNGQRRNAALPSISTNRTRSIADIIQREERERQQRKRGERKPSRQIKQRGKDGWDKSRLALGGLRLIDVNARLLAGRLRYQNLRLQNAQLNLKIAGGVMTAELPRMSLYGGRGNGKLRLDARKSQADLAANFSLSGMKALPFLKDLAGFKWIDGKTQAQLNVRGRGKSQHEIISSLDGKARLIFKDGAIIGYNVAQIVRDLKALKFTSLKRSQSQKTDFSSLTATYRISKGVAHNKDLLLVSPLLRMRGAGTADLGRQTLDYKMDPKLVADLSGQGGEVDREGIALPFRLTGPWANPKIQPDVAAARQAIKTIADKLKGKKGLSDAVKNLLGGNKTTPAPAAPSSTPPAAQTTTQPKPHTTPKPQEKKPTMQDLIDQILR